MVQNHKESYIKSFEVKDAHTKKELQTLRNDSSWVFFGWEGQWADCNPISTYTAGPINTVMRRVSLKNEDKEEKKSICFNSKIKVNK